MTTSPSAPRATLAASAEMLFPDQPFLQRVERLDDLGFAVESWDWTTEDLSALATTGARFSSVTGCLHGTGLDRRGLPVVAHEAPSRAEWLRAAHTLERVADSPHLRQPSASWSTARAIRLHHHSHRPARQP